MLLTSSLINPLAPVDEFRDLDIELVLENNDKYISDHNWTRNFGNPIAIVGTAIPISTPLYKNEKSGHPPA